MTFKQTPTNKKKNLIRIKSAVEVMQANYAGDLNKCKVTTEEERKNYCVRNMLNFDDVENCKVIHLSRKKTSFAISVVIMNLELKS